MSFMFHPYPYVDHDAVNAVSPDTAAWKDITFGGLAVGKRVAALLAGGKKAVGLDGYAGAELTVVRRMIASHLGGQSVEVIDLCEYLKPVETLRALVAPALPTDRTIDPVLLYGKRLEYRYEQFYDETKLALLIHKLQSGKPVLVVGRGALCDTLLPMYDATIWCDITPRTAAINFKQGRAVNLGEQNALPFGEMMRRNYYVDFELAVALRWSLIKQEKIDYYISCDVPESMAMLSFASLTSIFAELGQKPLRARPVYLEGVWGGFYLKRLRHLPQEMRNCAWIFDMIPMEVSLVAKANGQELETPFFTFVQQRGEKLLGKAVYDAFGGYFPVRFNYDDTFHSSGNMSIQCHPGAEYVMKNHGELGRQDESYYVCVAGQNACTYLGFKEENSCEEFFAEAERAQETHELMDYKRYVHAVSSKPGTQVMIPAGTIHASGHNQVILEIGSLTVGSYTYKLYDYQRLDPQTGLPRPIHLEAGKRVIHGERFGSWVDANLVNHGGVVREENGGKETVVGEHDLLYFSLRTLTFDGEMADDTKGKFHVLALTEGERVRIESASDASRCFEANYLDVIVVPADFGAYRIINLGQGAVTVHKTMVKGGFDRA